MTPSFKRTLIALLAACILILALAKFVQLGNQVHADLGAREREIQKWDRN
jgi:hypothetical protein